MNLKEATEIVKAEEIATMALEIQLGSYDDAIALVEDILPVRDARRVENILREWREIDRYDAEIYLDNPY